MSKPRVMKVHVGMAVKLHMSHTATFDEDNFMLQQVLLSRRDSSVPTGLALEPF
jgi:hypothetical protein